MIELSNIKVRLADGSSEDRLLAAARRAALRALDIAPADIARTTLRRVSIDARKKRDVHFMVTAWFELRAGISEASAIPAAARGARLVEDAPFGWPQPSAGRRPPQRPVVVGAGCAGLFAALALAEAGFEPLLIERGDDAARRTEAVRRFNETGALDSDSNIQFGLGGAGTFSDGKLTTGTKSASHRLILETLVAAGAPREILWDAKPHIGSDILPAVVEHIVARIRELGGEVCFRTRMVDVERAADGAVSAVRVADERESEERIACAHLVLACGHSARDVFGLLQRRGFALARKTFAMGARIEHMQADIDRAQYGTAAGHPALGAAPYKLVAHTGNGRGLFTFCMCPGGEVVAAASEPGGVVVNGASLHARAGRNANSALLVNVTPEDLPGDDVLAGVELQRRCERAAFELGGGGFVAPAQLMGDFLAGRPSSGAGHVAPTYPRGVAWGEIDAALPAHIVETMRLGLPMLARKLSAFADAEAVLTGVESRSSSPVTVVRGKDCVAVGAEGLYPCGEGAGYAGGIMSAAADGLRAAASIING